MSKNNRGGAREGSGRKAKAPTTTINFRVPVDKASYLKPLVSVYVKSLLAKEDEPPIEQVTEEPIKPGKSKAPVKQKIVSKVEPPKKWSLAEELEKVKSQK